MERPSVDGSGSGGAVVPASSSMVPTTNVPVTNQAGTNPTPMTVDDGIFYQPVQACFQFVQNHLLYMNKSNIDLFRHEAEERHSQIMEQMVQQLCTDYENRSLHVEQMCLSELAQQRTDAEMRHEHLASTTT
jgi:hypothetical protein